MQNRRTPAGHHPVQSFLFLTNPTMLLIGVLILSFSWHIDTPVIIEVEVRPAGPTSSLPDQALAQAIRDQSLPVLAGRISYPAFPNRPAVHFAAPEQLELDGETVRVAGHEPQTDGKRLIRLEGEATVLALVSESGRRRDLRLTQFDRIAASPTMLWAGIGLWLLATILGWIRVFQAAQS